MAKGKKRVTGDMELIRQKIVNLFFKNVRGKSPDISGFNKGHDGREGHWLERQMKLTHNASNTPDFEGFEMKNHTEKKTTFGDWSADYYIYKDKKYGLTRSSFLRIFGNPNPKKKGRFSWSGSPCPKIDKFNTFGQKLEIDNKGNILAVYSFKKDLRPDKEKIVPFELRKSRLIIARWDVDSLKGKLERKFNQLGWFKCKRDSDGFYSSIVFGGPIKYESWLDHVRKGTVYFDSGMYEGNDRPYSQWRADNKFWDEMITHNF